MDENVQSSSPMPPTQNPAGTVETWTGEPAETEDDVAKSLTDVAAEVLRGEWSIGQERRIALANAGFDPNAVKDEIVRIANSKT